MGNIIDIDGKPGKASTQSREGTNAKQKKEDPVPAYSQNVEFRGQAFSLYCKGLTCPQIADALRVEWPEVSTRTVQRIAKESKWDEARATFIVMHAKAQASAEGILPEVVLQLQRIRAQMEGRGITAAKDIYAYRQIVEDLMWYTGKHPKLKDSTPLAVSTEGEIAALLAVIAEDDVVGPAWKRRRPHIEKAYRDKLEASTKRSKGKSDKKAGNGS